MADTPDLPERLLDLVRGRGEGGSLATHTCVANSRGPGDLTHCGLGRATRVADLPPSTEVMPAAITGRWRETSPARPGPATQVCRSGRQSVPDDEYTMPRTQGALRRHRSH